MNARLGTMDVSLVGLYAFPVFVLLIAAEAIVFARRQRAYPWVDSANSLVICFQPSPSLPSRAASGRNTSLK